MPDNPQQNNNLTPFQRLPDDIKDAMSSIENAEINGKIAEKYEITKDELPLMINIIGRVIMKGISLMDFPRALKDALNLDVETTKAMALDIAIRRLLPLKNHLGDVEGLIRKLGGEAPKNIPSFASAKGGSAPGGKASEGKPPFAQSIKTPPTPPPPSFLRKDLRTILKDNKEAEEQLITSQPIRIEGFNGLVRPSLKNWLSDYIRLEGVGPHSLMVLTNYLYNSTNGKILNPKERKVLGKILQSYSENASLPVSEKTGLIALEELEKEAAGTPPLPPTPSYARVSGDRPLPPKSPVPPVFSSFVRQPADYEDRPVESLPKQDLPTPPAPEKTYPNPPFSPTQSPSEALREGGPIPSPAPLQPSRSSIVRPERTTEDKPSFVRSGRTMEDRPPRPPEPIRQKHDSYLEPINDLESDGPLPMVEPRPGQRGAQPRLDSNIIDLKNFRQS